LFQPTEQPVNQSSQTSPVSDQLSGFQDGTIIPVTSPSKWRDHNQNLKRKKTRDTDDEGYGVSSSTTAASTVKNSNSPSSQLLWITTSFVHPTMLISGRYKCPDCVTCSQPTVLLLDFGGGKAVQDGGYSTAAAGQDYNYNNDETNKDKNVKTDEGGDNPNDYDHEDSTVKMTTSVPTTASDVTAGASSTNQQRVYNIRLSIRIIQIACG